MTSALMHLHAGLFQDCRGSLHSAGRLLANAPTKPRAHSGVYEHDMGMVPILQPAAHEAMPYRAMPAAIGSSAPHLEIFYRRLRSSAAVHSASCTS